MVRDTDVIITNTFKATTINMLHQVKANTLELNGKMLSENREIIFKMNKCKF